MNTKRKGIKIFVILVLSLFVVLSVVTFIQYSVYKNSTEIHTLTRRNSISIDMSYPVLHDKAADAKIKTVLKDIQDEFAIEAKTQGANSAKLIITYEIHEYEGITHLRFSTSDDLPVKAYIGDRSLHFSVGGNDDLAFGDFFSDYKTAKKALETYASNYITYDLKAKQKTFKKEDISLCCNISSNLKFFYFDDQCLHMIFSGGKLSESDLDIPVYYPKANRYLKDEFAQNNAKRREIYSKRDITKYTNAKVVALTFDDGPSLHTETLLDHIEGSDVKVTFFIQGYRLKTRKKTLERAYQMGNEIGVHSYDHPVYSTMSMYDVFSQQEKTIRSIYAITGEYPTLTRPPYGEYDSRTLEAIDMPAILWNVDPKDWKDGNVNRIVNHCVSKASDGSIILLHDTSSASIKAGIKIIDELTKKGYVFLTVDEMAEHYNTKLEQAQVYRFIKPE